MTKQCKGCNETKNLNDFSPRKDTRDKKQPRCKTCCNRMVSSLYHKNLSESRKKKNAYSKLPHVKERTKKYKKQRWHTDPNYRMKGIIGNLTRQSLSGRFKAKKTLELLGCSWDFFVSYFKSKMSSDMTWQDFLDGKIHIDHIKPCSKFDLSIAEHQGQCFHYTNLQPLWAKDNIIKGDLWIA